MHLSQSTLYNKDNLIKDIILHNAAYDIGTIEVSYGEFPNVPLIGTNGFITYNPSLAYRQLGYSLDNKPNSLLVTHVFMRESEENMNLIRDVVKDWSHISPKKKSELGPRNCVA